MTLPSLPEMWLSTSDAARTIGVSDWFVRERIESGEIPALAITSGRRKIYRIRASDWARFVAAYTGPAAVERMRR